MINPIAVRTNRRARLRIEGTPAICVATSNSDFHGIIFLGFAECIVEQLGRQVQKDRLD